MNNTIFCSGHYYSSLECSNEIQLEIKLKTANGRLALCPTVLKIMGQKKFVQLNLDIDTAILKQPNCLRLNEDFHESDQDELNSLINKLEEINIAKICFYKSNTIDPIFQEYRLYKNSPSSVIVDRTILNQGRLRIVDNFVVIDVLYGSECKCIYTASKNYFAGDRIEYISFYNRGATVIDWSQGMNVLNPDSTDRYKRIIYPTCLAYLQYFTDVAKEEKRKLSILEVGGGDGTLAKKILDLFTSTIHQYYFIELHDLPYKKACQQLDLYTSKQVIPYQGDLTQLDYKHVLSDNLVDIVIACGVFNVQVLESRTASLMALKKIADTIKPNGFVILTGYSPSYVQSSDLKQLNFEIKNMVIPFGCNKFSFYVARRVSNKKE